MSREKVYITPGEFGEATMPHSEVCMHMRVAGKRLKFFLKEGEYPSVQLFNGDHPFSSPILTGEAGLYRDEGGFYYYA